MKRLNVVHKGCFCPLTRESAAWLVWLGQLGSSVLTVIDSCNDDVSGGCRRSICFF